MDMYKSPVEFYCKLVFFFRTISKKNDSCVKEPFCIYYMLNYFICYMSLMVNLRDRNSKYSLTRGMELILVPSTHTRLMRKVDHNSNRTCT